MLIRAGEQMAFVLSCPKQSPRSAPSWMTHIIIVDAKKQNIRLFKMWLLRYARSSQILVKIS